MFRILEAKLTRALSQKRPTEEVTEIVAEMLSTQAMDRELKVIKILDQRDFLQDPPRVEEFVRALDAKLAEAGLVEAHARVKEFHRSLLKYDSGAARLYLKYMTESLVNRLKQDADSSEVAGEFLDERQRGEAAAALDRIAHNVKREGLLRSISFWGQRKNKP